MLVSCESEVDFVITGVAEDGAVAWEASDQFITDDVLSSVEGRDRPYIRSRRFRLEGLCPAFRRAGFFFGSSLHAEHSEGQMGPPSTGSGQAA